MLAGSSISGNVNLMSRENPLQDPLRFDRKTPPCAVVIFGANGDLTKRKLMPALYRLAYEGRLAPGFAVIGISRTAMSDDDFRDKHARFREEVPGRFAIRRRTLATLSRRACFTWRATSAIRHRYQKLGKCLEEVEKERADRRQRAVLSFHAAQPVCARSRKAWATPGWRKGSGWRRIVIEKPFGHDLASARELNDRLHEVFR